MLPFKLSMDRVERDTWGAPEDFGATTIEGQIKVAGKLLFGTLEAAVSSDGGSLRRKAGRV